MQKPDSFRLGERSRAVLRLANSKVLCVKLDNNGFSYATKNFDKSVLTTHYESIMLDIVTSTISGYVPVGVNP